MKRILVKVLFLSVMMAVSSSCMIRFDRKALKDALDAKKSMMIKPSGVMVTKDTALSGFTSINVMGSMDVKFVQAERSGNVQIQGSDNIIPYVDISLENDALNISWKEELSWNRFYHDDDYLTVFVYAPEIEMINIVGSSYFSIDELSMPDKGLSVKSSGSGDVEIGNLAVSSLDINVKGSSDIHFRNVASQNIGIRIFGSGEVYLDEVEVSDIDASISGSGDIRIAGNARTATYKVSGSGDIDASALKCLSTNTKISGSGSIAYQDAEGRRRFAED